MKRKTTMRRANRRTLLDRMPTTQVSAIIMIVMVVATILDMLNSLFWANGIVRVLAGTIFVVALLAKLVFAAKRRRLQQMPSLLRQAWQVLPNTYRVTFGVFLFALILFETTFLTVTRLYRSNLLLVSLVLVDLWLASRILFFLADNAPEGTDDEDEDDEDEDDDEEDEDEALNLKELATRQAKEGDFSFIDEIDEAEVIVSLYRNNPTLQKLTLQKVNVEGWVWLNRLPKEVVEMLYNDTDSSAEPDGSDSEGAAEHGDGSTNTKSFPWKQVTYLLALIWSAVVALALAGKFRPLAIGNLIQIAIPLLCGMFGKHINAFRPQKIIWGVISMGLAGDSIPGFLITLVLWILVVKGSKEELSWEEGSKGMIASFTPIGITGIPVPWKKIRFYRSPKGYLEANEIYHLPFVQKAVLSSSVDDLFQLEDPEYHSSFWELLLLGCAKVRCIRLRDKDHPLVFRIPTSLAKQAAFSGGELKALLEQDRKERKIVRHQH